MREWEGPKVPMPEKSIGLPSGGAGQWFEFVPPVEGASERKRKKTSPSPEVVSSLQAKAKAILDGEVAWLDSDKGRKAKSTNNDAGFLRKIMSSGTLSDKMVGAPPPCHRCPAHTPVHPPPFVPLLPSLRGTTCTILLLSDRRSK